MLNLLLMNAPTAAAVAACILSIWKGGPPERAGGLLIGGAWIAAFIAYPLASLSGAPYPIAPYVPFAIDGVVAVGLLGLAMRYSSAWLGFAVLLQAGELALHAAFLTGDGSGGRAYIARVNMLGVALTVLLAAATLNIWLRRVFAERAAITARDRTSASGFGRPLTGAEKLATRGR